MSTIAEIAANLMQLQLRTETFLSHSAGQQAMTGNELVAFFEVPVIEEQGVERHGLEGHGSRTLQLETITLAIPADQSASWQVCA